MIVVDSSALLAILLLEPEADRFIDVLLAQDHCVVSAVNAHESAVVLRLRQGVDAADRVWRLLADEAIEVVPFDQDQARCASEAYARYGKGIDPRARLNLCDCVAYALAKMRDAPLLFKGDDFPHTDARSAL